jgi:hypothetical protein
MDYTSEELMTSAEICSALKISKNTLHSKRWRKGVQIPTFRIGKYLLVNKEAFKQWFKQRMIVG